MHVRTLKILYVFSIYISLATLVAHKVGQYRKKNLASLSHTETKKFFFLQMSYNSCVGLSVDKEMNDIVMNLTFRDKMAAKKVPYDFFFFAKLYYGLYSAVYVFPSNIFQRFLANFFCACHKRKLCMNSKKETIDRKEKIFNTRLI